MAEVFNSRGWVEYSLKSGAVRTFHMDGTLFFDEKHGGAVDGWEQKLAEVVRDARLNIPSNGPWLHSFVHKMIDDGLTTVSPAAK